MRLQLCSFPSILNQYFIIMRVCVGFISCKNLPENRRLYPTQTKKGSDQADVDDLY
jgi:hypothetical protein